MVETEVAVEEKESARVVEIAGSKSASVRILVLNDE